MNHAKSKSYRLSLLVFFASIIFFGSPSHSEQEDSALLEELIAEDLPKPKISFNFAQYPMAKTNLDAAKKMAADYFKMYLKVYNEEYAKLRKIPIEYTNLRRMDANFFFLLKKKTKIEQLTPEKIVKITQNMIRKRVGQFERTASFEIAQHLVSIDEKLNQLQPAIAKATDSGAGADRSAKDQIIQDRLRDIEDYQASIQKNQSQFKMLLYGNLALSIVLLLLYALKVLRE